MIDNGNLEQDQTLLASQRHHPVRLNIAVVAVVGIIGTVLLTACSSGTAPVASMATPTATVNAAPAVSTPGPSPSTVVSTVRVPVVQVTETKAAPAPTVIVVNPGYPAPAQPYRPDPWYRWNGDPGYSGPAYGTFQLTRFAYPGPIHSYSSPRDTASFVETIPATSWVTVYCSVVAQDLQDHPYWDWDGSGWIWDYMVDIGGNTPPSC